MHTCAQFLKYSDEDLMKLVQLAKRRANQRERHKVDYDKIKFLLI